MSSSEPLQDTAAVVGILEWGSKEIKNAVKHFRERNLAFIGNPETIIILTEEKHSSEWRLYDQYVKDRRLRLLVQLGLTLRKLEGSPESLLSLRDRIVRKFSTEGLHIAQFVQNEVLSTFLALTITQRQSPADMTHAIESLLNDVDRYGVFIQATDESRSKAKELAIRLHANLPETLILFGSKSAKDIAAEIAKRLEKEADSQYDVTRQETKYRIIFIFSRRR